VAAALAQAGQMEHAASAFAEAREMAGAIEGDTSRAGALCDVAAALVQAGQVEQAESAFAERGRRRRRLRMTGSGRGRCVHWRGRWHRLASSPRRVRRRGDGGSLLAGVGIE